MRYLTADNGPLPYFPARLGWPVQGKSKGGSEDVRVSPRQYEAWRESFAVEPQSWQERSETAAFAELRRGGAGPQVILGEPGAGKTRLLEEWASRWWTDGCSSVAFGMRLAVLIPLRLVAVSNGMVTPYRSGDDGEGALADGLWRLAGSPAGSPISGRFALPQRRGQARLFSPVWLLDGLDELPCEFPLADWLRAFAMLPGDVVITCRTAVWQAERSLAGATGSWHVETVMPLRSAIDRAAFLRPGLGIEADRLAAQLSRHAALSPLASNPLLLDLAALLWREDPGLLPASRVEFYRRAVAVLWKRKVPVALRDRTGDRDRVLEILAVRMGLKPEAGKQTLVDTAYEVAHADAATLLDGLRATGLLRFDDGRETVSFLHLSFQEYYLSAALMRGGVLTPVEQHWEDPRYEEVLALLLARLTADGHPDEATRGLAWLIKRSWHYSKKRQLRCRAGRSPLRVALHLLARSGLPIETQRQLRLRLDEEVGQGTLRALAAAADPSMPAAMLERLAGDPDAGVRQSAAQNSSLPVAALERLAGDPDTGMRRRLAQNPSLPAAALGRLAGDPDEWVRRFATLNPSLPAAALERLAGDPDAGVRQGVVGNPSLPAAALERLVDDPDAWVRREAAGNRSLPAAALERLARDPDAGVRRSAVGNPSLPAAALERLAGDSDVGVRQSAAGNPSMPVAALERLAGDCKRWVREAAAGNPSMPAAALERLAAHPDTVVRRSAALNPNMLFESLPTKRPVLWRLWRWLQRIRGL